MQKKQHLIYTAMLLALFVLVGGCGKSKNKQDTVKVEGTFKIDGKPYGPATLGLTMEPFDMENPNVGGAIKEDGTFVLTTYDEGDGAPVGKYKVSVTSDAMAVKMLPALQPHTVEITKPEGDGPLKLEINMKTAKGGSALPGGTGTRGDEGETKKGPGGI